MEANIEPKSSPSPKSHPRPSWSQAAGRSPFRRHLGAFLEAPGTLKIMLPLQCGLTFSLKSLIAPGLQNQAQKAPKIEAKSLPGGFKKASKRVSKKASMLDPILKLFLSILEAPGGRGAERQNGFQNRFTNGLGFKARSFHPRKPILTP